MATIITGAASNLENLSLISGNLLDKGKALKLIEERLTAISHHLKVSLDHSEKAPNVLEKPSISGLLPVMQERIYLLDEVITDIKLRLNDIEVYLGVETSEPTKSQTIK